MAKKDLITKVKDSEELKEIYSKMVECMEERVRVQEARGVEVAGGAKKMAFKQLKKIVRFEVS